ncbi:hypothetical protein AAVH_16571 [Aphelenchoides avenae]|nr:hypothetical protein AAVH_16571 [Aphelenchus avenae]
MTNETTTHDAPGHSDHDTAADSTDDRRPHHHQVTGEGTHSIHRATTTTPSDSTRPITVRPALLAEEVMQPKPSSCQLPHPRQQLLSRRGTVLSDLPSWQRTVLPPKLSSYQPPQPRRQGPVLANLPPLAEESIAAEAASTSLIPVHQQISRSRLAILATSGPTATDATGSVDTEGCSPANSFADTLTVFHGHTIFQELISEPAMHLPDAEDYRTVRHAASTPTLQAVVGRAARADPLDQEENTTIFAPMDAPNHDCKPDSANIYESARCKLDEALALAKQTTMDRRFPAEAATDHTTSPAARRVTHEEPATDCQPSVAYRAPAEAALDQAASSQEDDDRFRRDNRDESPLKNETVCLCDESTFRYFGRLLRPEVLMIPISVSSLEDALQSVSDLHPTKEVSRVILWFSDSYAAPTCTADQLRLAVEFSSYYATHYQDITQYVVATPSVSNRQDVWTCGLFKLQVQMQMLLPHARLIMRPRCSRSVTHADVVGLKRYLRVHHHLDLWSRYDADVPRDVAVPYSPTTPQQQHAMPSTTCANRSAADVSALQPHHLTGSPCDFVPPTTMPKRNTGNASKATPKDGTVDAATHGGLVCPPGKTGSRQRRGLRYGSAVQTVIQFPPPPSQTRFRSTPLPALLGVGSARTTNSTSLVDLARARKPKPRCRSKPALLAVREPTKTYSRGKRKEHTFRDEDHHHSKDKQTSAAPALASKPAKQQPRTS